MATEHAWPPAAGLATVNVPRAAVILTSSASTRIPAPADEVFRIVRDVEHYGEWNNFCPRVTIHQQPEGKNDSMLHKGTLFTFHVIMDEKKPKSETDTQLIVTDISTPDQPSDYVPKRLLEDASFTADLSSVYRIGWKCEGGFASKGLRTERFHEIIVLGPSECEVRTWETQGGLLAHTVKWLYKKTLDAKFNLWCDDLKHCCERGSQGHDAIKQ